MQTYVEFDVLHQSRGRFVSPRGTDANALVSSAAAFVSLERLCLSPQCGFASADLGTELTECDQIAKLQLVVDAATEIWNEPA